MRAPLKSGARNLGTFSTQQVDRVFEFQIMPQLLNIVKLDNNSSQNMNEATVDWGTIAIYTCEKSCNSSGNQYKREFAWKQTMP